MFETENLTCTEYLLLEGESLIKGDSRRKKGKSGFFESVFWSGEIQERLGFRGVF